MIYIIRNNQQFGPYDESTILSYVNNGQILLCDSAKEVTSGTENTVQYFLKRANLKPKIKSNGNLIEQLKAVGSELFIPKDAFNRKQWIADKRLLMLALIGLIPLTLGYITRGGFFMFYTISLFFATIWGLFFFYLFKTPQVKLKTTLLLFFGTQAAVFLIFETGINQINPFYFIGDENGFILDLIFYIFAVGVTEESVKLLPLTILYKTSKQPLIPQTLVFYGLMSGIAFGVYEGVSYQIGINSQLDYDTSFFLNIARLTSLPFLHAIWCGIGGYFYAFSKLYPKYRVSLCFLAIAVPAILHGIYDTFTGSLLGTFIALAVAFIAVVLLMTYLKQGVNNQSKLRS